MAGKGSEESHLGAIPKSKISKTSVVTELPDEMRGTSPGDDRRRRLVSVVRAHIEQPMPSRQRKKERSAKHQEPRERINVERAKCPISKVKKREMTMGAKL